MGEEEKAQSWWKTIPGILTAAAAVITAVSGLILALHQIGIFNAKSPTPSVLSQERKAPVLISPRNGANLPQPYNGSWHFKWVEPPNMREVQQYHLIVINNTAALTLVDTKIKQKTFTVRSKECSYIADKNRFNWVWKVRAQDQQGVWGPWSDELSFNVEKFNPQIFYEICPRARHRSRTGE